MEVLKEGFFGSIHSVYSIAIIIIPIMIALQVLKDFKILDKITKPFNFLSRIFKTSDEAVLPLLVGIIFGLSYGAGVIIQSAKEGELTKRDLLIITIFLATCHAVFEDTLLFVAVGANGFIIIGTRLVAAFILTCFIAKKTSVVISLNANNK
ncbi:nucleoside recognition domain-containing protein [Alkaliphilus serpentinus]|uniref:Nucleoside recognition protein n=1 Tax=Alkaliphilus serpentinus TaxID=1482731 RepID=A0A833MCS9_9FIRM|nr:nucleoside recognition domain-containing protein [Alkaliphilus serpentinus]KAB3526343.1 nucleoside recognition protein [Alkaliphilus serpentinus]